MSPADSAPIPALTPEGPEPHFFEPWQARAFAMTVALADAGAIAWTDWADALGTRLGQAPTLPTEAGGADHARQYFTAWMATLEHFLAREGIDRDAVGEAALTWQRAAHATPHGQPILFATGLARKG